MLQPYNFAVYLLIFTVSSISSIFAFINPTAGLLATNRKLPSTHRLSASMSAVKTSSRNDNDDIMVGQTQHQHLVLVGGGHAHVQVIKALSQRNPKELKVTLIDLQSHACYSGMVPGCVADLYTPQETLIDLEALAKWSGITFVQGRVVDMDADEKIVHVLVEDCIGTGEKREVGDDKNRKETRHIPFDCLSMDIGSTSRDFDRITGAREYTIPTRPITALVHHVQRAREKAKQANVIPKIAVVGGGVAGMELALAVTSQWRSSVHPNTTCTILTAAPTVLPNESATSRQALMDVLQQQGVTVQCGCQVSEVKKDRVVANLIRKDGKGAPVSVFEVEFTHCLWATGAGAHELAWTLGGRGSRSETNEHSSRLSINDQGWIVVGPTLQSTSHPHIFAAGDCASIQIPASATSTPRTVPKAGVYAVRAGPVLIENLTRYLNNTKPTTKEANGGITKQESPSSLLLPLEEYQPQDDFLKLIVCSHEGRALGLRFGMVLYGKWVFALKDAIDRKFLELFDVTIMPPSPFASSSVEEEDQQKKKYDTSQYDDAAAQDASVLLPESPKEAAALLQRTDDQVDYLQAWKVIRTMTADAEYRQAVLLEHKAATSLTATTSSSWS